MMVMVPKPFAKNRLQEHSTEQTWQFKALKLKYLGPLKAIILVTTLQYKLA